MERLLEYAKDGIATGFGKAMVIGVFGAGMWTLDTYIKTFEDEAVARSVKYTEKYVSLSSERNALERAKLVAKVESITEEIESNRIELKQDMQRAEDKIINEIRSLHK